MTVKLGKENIQRLITSVLEKHDSNTGKETSRNQTVTNYSSLANQLTIISGSLPELCPQTFLPDPGGKYVITGAQVRDAYFGKVDSLKDHFYEACHLFLYNKLSADCKEEIKETELLQQSDPLQPPAKPEKIEKAVPQPTKRPVPLLALSIILFALLLFTGYK